MSIESMLATISKIVSTFKWDNFISILIGGLITGYISYKFLKRREKDKLKIDLQVKATEQLLEDIKVVDDKASKLFIPGFSSFQDYNSTLTHIENNMLSDDYPMVKSTMEDLYNKQLNQAKDRVSKSMDNFFESWNEYSLSYSKFINSFETKMVILNKFIGIKELLFDELKLIMNIENKIMNLYYFEISNYITYSKPIDNSLINQLADLENNLQEKKVDIISIFYDMKIGLQNEFLGELYEFKIPTRQPIDEVKYPVYKPGYKHSIRQEKDSI